MQVAIFGASYARLANAAREDPDPLPEVQDARRFLAASLEAFSKAGFSSVPLIIRAAARSRGQCGSFKQTAL